ncbi:MAG: D-tyrosyl-tRNA(Tyr) deacylase [Ignavibacteriae bacterium]|nr:D-tyrosyl-tRNA(Tyr) deacylase [Ignavibacteriota bacterium]
MRVVVQRVSEAGVTIDGNVHASIGRGYVILLGIRTGDTHEAATFLAEKCAGLRVFEDDAGKMNLSLKDVGGSVIVVSQFTLYGDAQKGNRPSFIEAARPEEAEPLYDLFVARMKALLGDERVQTGVFRAMMQVKIVNDGPVTILIESK